MQSGRNLSGCLQGHRRTATALYRRKELNWEKSALVITIPLYLRFIEDHVIICGGQKITTDLFSVHDPWRTWSTYSSSRRLLSIDMKMEARV